MTVSLPKLTPELSDVASDDPSVEEKVLQERAFVDMPGVHGLYVHVPFCVHKCGYCDFYSLAEPSDLATDRQQVFVEAMLKEIHRRAGQVRLEPTTVFVGGGTPSLLRPDLWQLLLDDLAELGVLDRIVEFTVEANPEIVTDDLLALLAARGVNRISLGAQSFSTELLQVLERSHDPVSVANAVTRIRRAGIELVNLDLIFGIPGQTLKMVGDDLDAALALEPDHLSYYSLIYEPNTPMTQHLRAGRIQRVDEQIERDMFAMIIDCLAEAGFEHYEISNWAKAGGPPGANDADESTRTKTVCLHNLQYWTNANWLGVGPSAASHINGYRWKNAPHIGQYLGSLSPPIADYEHLPPARYLGEVLMLRLRLLEGVPCDWLDTNLPADDPRWQTIEHLVQIGMLKRTHSHVRLTRAGLFIADEVVGRLL